MASTPVSQYSSPMPGFQAVHMATEMVAEAAGPIGTGGFAIDGSATYGFPPGMVRPDLSRAEGWFPEQAPLSVPRMVEDYDAVIEKLMMERDRVAAAKSMAEQQPIIVMTPSLAIALRTCKI